MVAHRRRDVLELRHTGNDPRATFGMAAYDLPLLRVKLALFAQDCGIHRDLAHIMDDRGGVDVV